MAVHFTQDLVPIEGDPTILFPEFDADEHRFADVTMAMVRDIINIGIETGAAGRIAGINDPRLVLDLMQWWNDLPTTCKAMPVFILDNRMVSRLYEMKDLCHVCHNKLPTLTCTVCTVAAAAAADPVGTTTIGRDESVAAIVRGDLKRLGTILSSHRDMFRCPRYPRLGVLGKLQTTMECVSSLAWSVPMNSILGRHLGWTFLGSQCHHSDIDILNPALHATQQMKAYYALSTMKPPNGHRPVLARLEQLDDAATATTYSSDKLAIQRTLYEYLNHLFFGGTIRGTLKWIPQPHLLRQALHALETCERDMQCTRLALVVRALFQQHDPLNQQADDHSAMDIVTQRVNDFLGATEDDRAYLSEWLS